jgi:hypothetical protein
MECKYQALSAARSVEEIVSVTRDYLSSWTREELERLPDSCRPGRVITSGDIEFWADRLAGESAKATLFVDDERKLERMTNHFLIASVRIRQLGPLPHRVAA